MATILDQYYQSKQKCTEQMAAGSFANDRLLNYQELLYRINVLESCMTFCKTAPVTTKMEDMGYHYQLVDAMMTCMLQERKIGIPADDKLKQQRVAAHNNLTVIVGNFRKKFKSFTAATPQAYKDEVTRMINTVLPAWLQYRYTYMPF